MTWVPGRELVLLDQLQTENGLVSRQGSHTYNQYQPTALKPGDAKKAGPWLDHCKTVYGDEADHMIVWLAHRVQRPWEKINHSLVMGGVQGIGKDTILEPVKRAVGSSNFKEVSPREMVEDNFNDYVRAVILRISEAHDLGEVNRFAFYERNKVLTAAPPDVLRCNCKNMSAIYLPNVVGVIQTTNHRYTAIYLPPDDRRHFVLWSTKVKEDFTDAYWNKLWAYYDNGGDGHVMAHLLQLDISAFNPKAPPPKTAAWHDIVEANATPEDVELADALDALGKDDPNNKDQKIRPDVVTIEKIKAHAADGLRGWLSDRRNARTINHRFERCGYEVIRAHSNEGRWIIDRTRQVVFAKKSLTKPQQYQEAEKLTDSYRRNHPETPPSDELPF